MLKQDQNHMLSTLQARLCNDIFDKIERIVVRELVKESVKDSKELLNKVK